MEQFKKKFIDEANDLINELEKALLNLEKTPEDKTLIEHIFRAMHSLKGGSSMFGFTRMDKFTHHLESLYDLVRNNKLQVDDELINITFNATDHLKKFISTGDEPDNSTSQENELLIERIINIINSCSNDSSKNIAPIENNKNIEEKKNNSQPLSTYYILFEPNEDILKFGNNPLYILDEISQHGKCIVFPRTTNIPDLTVIDPTKCYLYWELFIATASEKNTLQDIFIFIENHCKLRIEKLSETNLLENNDFIKNINSLALKSEKFEINEIKQLTIPAILQAKKVEKFALSLKEKKSKINSDNNPISTIRVASNKLDMLMNFVSELVTTQARLSLYAEQSNSAELVSIAENIEKISRNLRDNAFSICLIPLESVLTRFQRLVRDLSSELNKDVAFIIEGAETELDKSIIESITDPIMHILRNSLDHGIEEPSIRKKLNKPQQGQIILKAFYSGANVIIKIQDDGAGIDIEKIKAKAINMGLINNDSILTKKEIYDLLFLPGFSTATKVTDVSGRGVGMDVVKRKINEIRGEVEVDSEVDKGTAITITLPLTLSIIDGLLVKIAHTQFVIPLSAVIRIYAVEHAVLKDAFNNFVVLDDKRYPFYYLRDEFEMEDSSPLQIEQIVLVYYEGTSIGLVVDTIIGQYQAVLKPLGKVFKNQEIISGASILGDGSIALVFDTNKIIKRFSNEK